MQTIILNCIQTNHDETHSCTESAVYHVAFTYLRTAFSATQSWHVNINRVWFIVFQWSAVLLRSLSLVCWSSPTESRNFPLLQLEGCVVPVLHENTLVGGNVGIYWASKEVMNTLTFHAIGISYRRLFFWKQFTVLTGQKRKSLPTQTCEFLWLSC